MNWKTLINDKIKRAFVDLCEAYPEGPENFALDSRDYEYADLRSSFLEFEAAARSASVGAAKHTYTFDLEFGLRTYEYLNNKGFGLWEASDNGCWAYLSIKVVPDIVYRRWNEYNEDRFYKRNGRRWLKAIWWYIHLSESGKDGKFDIESTRELLKDNSQDIIQGLLDHIGDGFRDTVYHQLMKKHHEVCESGIIKGNREDFFRAIMLQHQISTMVIDPVLADEETYVNSLYERVLPLYMERRK